MITLKEAQKIVEGCLNKAREENMMPVTIAVVDTRGVLVSSAMEDNSAIIRPDIAFAKAWGCFGIGFSSREIRNLIGAQPEQTHFFHSVRAMSGNKIAPSPGGIMIKKGDDVIGAVGVSGDLPDRDEICAIAGVEVAGLTYQI
tara:strand:+ start:110 stop:538 length:429 start_codon:yes stop_codon:yes gene_type:complete